MSIQAQLTARPTRRPRGPSDRRDRVEQYSGLSSQFRSSNETRILRIGFNIILTFHMEHWRSKSSPLYWRSCGECQAVVCPCKGTRPGGGEERRHYQLLPRLSLQQSRQRPLRGTWLSCPWTLILMQALWKDIQIEETPLLKHNNTHSLTTIVRIIFKTKLPRIIKKITLK